MPAERLEELRQRLSRQGHGHVVPREDGVKTRCGGVGLCVECSIEAASMNGAQKREREAA